jgi:hypothetical protein
MGTGDCDAICAAPANLPSGTGCACAIAGKTNALNTSNIGVFNTLAEAIRKVPLRWIANNADRQQRRDGELLASRLVSVEELDGEMAYHRIGDDLVVGLVGNDSEAAGAHPLPIPAAFHSAAKQFERFRHLAEVE